MRVAAAQDAGVVTDGRVVVVGAGVAGLAAAHALVRRAPGLDVVVLEQASRAGGLVQTERTPEGFVVEHGADTMITTKPWGVQAAHEVGLAGDLVGGTGPRRTYVATGGRLVPLPQVFAGPQPSAVLGILRSPLLTPAGKARLALEPFVPPRRDGGDESVGAFITRRFGREMLEALIDPLLGGIYGAEAARLSAEACLGALRAMEREHRSVTLGMHRALRARRRRARAGDAVLPPAVTLRAGMGSLPEALAHALGDRLRLGVAVRRLVARAGGRFRVETDGGALDCDGVVLAVPAWKAPEVLDGAAPDLAAALAGVPHKALDCVTLAWPRRDVPHALDGTGWIRAAGDPRPTAACTWASRKWPGRAPEGFVLVRSVLSAAGAAPEELVEAARGDLRDLVGVTAAPSFSRVRRIPRGTPVYEVGHLERTARMAEQAAGLGRLALAGNAHGGVGVPDCVRSGERAAEAVLAGLQAARRSTTTGMPSDGASVTARRTTRTW